MRRSALREFVPPNTLRSLRATFFVVVLSAHAHAAEPSYPIRPIRFIVPNGAGGTTDLVARSVSSKVADMFGQQIVIDNRPGSGGILGTELAARAPADGYSLLMGTIGNIAISPALYRKLAYDSLRDFAPVTQLATAAYMLLVHPALSAKSVNELAALAKAKPGALNMGSAGSGTGSHLAGELFKAVAGIDIVHVPYKTGAPALTDVISGQIQLFFNGIPSSMPHLRAGRVRALAVTSTARTSVAPELPTLAEMGYAGAEAASWTGVLVPNGTPAPFVIKLNAAFVKSLQFVDVTARLQAEGAVPVGSSAADFDAYIKREYVKWAKVVKASGATVQ